MNLPPVLAQLAADIDALREPTPSSLAALLQWPISIDDVAPFIRFDPVTYVRSLVARDARWELRLLCWRPGQTSSLHGHGRAACAFRILRGNATESILGSRDRVFAPGDVVAESRAELVHQVGNAGADPLLTLHAYSPPLPVDAPAPRGGKRVVIIGGGFSGAAVAVHLLRLGGADLRIDLVERGPWIGRGVAYSVDSPVFRLNVPAAKMSLDPQAPDDFVSWAGVEATPNAFLPRSRYAEYVVARFGEALRQSPGKLRIVRGDASHLEGQEVVLADGRRLLAETVVLATGLAPRLAPGSLPADARIVDAWDECALATLPASGRVLVLGAGLTALDVLALLEARGFSGQTVVLSRRGLLPRPHLAPLTAPRPLPPELLATLPATARALVGWGRRVVRSAEAGGETWQHGIDSLRPHLGTLWRNLPARERVRFVRSVRPYWEVLRHRAPADAHPRLEAWKREGRMEVVAGSVSACVAESGGLEVELRLAGGRRRRERFDAIVRCLGPALERSEAEAPLVRSLIEQGRAAADPAGLGMVTDPRGRVVGPDGRADSSLFALGALRRASGWETTSVPDIAVHAHAIAREIVG